MDFLKIAQAAKAASLEIANTETNLRNKALLKIADELEACKDEIFEANKADLNASAKFVEWGEMPKSVFNRLKLDNNKMRDMIQGIRDVAQLPDPINHKLLVRELDKDLILYKISCPIGVLGIIFEARPDVIAQISALAIKSANAVILKGGKEAKNTNKKIYEVITKALAKEVGPSNIRVNCVAPGVIDTEMNSMLDSDTISELCDETPLGRLGRADEVANTIYYLAQDNTFITGQVISPNGGLVI